MSNNEELDVVNKSISKMLDDGDWESALHEIHTNPVFQEDADAVDDEDQKLFSDVLTALDAAHTKSKLRPLLRNVVLRFNNDTDYDRFDVVNKGTQPSHRFNIHSKLHTQRFSYVRDQQYMDTNLEDGVPYISEIKAGSYSNIGNFTIYIFA